jgi:uroporphyrinogen-III synthase
MLFGSDFFLRFFFVWLRLAIREAWLQIPIYCLTGATFASVKEVGFKIINPSDTSDVSSTFGNSSSSPSFDNAAQLVDFLISLKWPAIANASSGTANGGLYSARNEAVFTSEDAERSVNQPASTDPISSSAPELWFLTGETRMKTLAEKLSIHRRAFREVVVYETGPRLGFEEELSLWVASTLDLHIENNAAGLKLMERQDVQPQGTPAAIMDKNTDVWLVGFSPKGVDLTVPVLRKSLEPCKSSTAFSTVSVRIHWGSIGPTTAARIQEHLQATTIISKSGSKVTFSSNIAVAKAPKPAALAEAIASHLSS